MKAIISFFIIAAAASGCQPAQPRSSEIADLTQLKQDAFTYVEPSKGDQLIVPAEVQQKFYAQFQNEFFSPWNIKELPSLAEVDKPFERFEKSSGYGQNSIARSPEFARRLQELANLNEYPNCNRSAIMVANSDLREMPTNEPIFADLPGTPDGYPFDLLQSSTLPVGSPVHLCHVSRDGRWAFVVTNCGQGWVERRNLAIIGVEKDPSLTFGASCPATCGSPINKTKLVSILKDGLSICDTDGQFLFIANIGSVFPVAGGDEATGLEIFVPVADKQCKAVSRRVKLQPGDAAIMPLPFTQNNIARLANQMIGQPYGWGGMYGSRDCSATTRDLFIPFGLHLPRNSSQQAKTGDVVSLEKIPAADRERLIVEKGVPWLTLVRYPGHIMLYIGQVGGRPVVLHNFWGIKTRRGGTEGRFIVGRCAITTLTPGAELSDIARPDGLIVNRINSFIILPPATKQPATHTSKQRDPENVENKKE